MELEPTRQVAPQPDVALLLESMSHTGFQGRQLGESFKAWKKMIAEPGCSIFLGLSGAMIPAGMQRCLIELAERRFIDIVVSTGANVFHDVCEHLGVRHYRGYHHVNDQDLFEQGIDRIYDVFAYEEQFRDIDREIATFSSEIAPFNGSSAQFIAELGKWLIDRRPEGSSFTATCARMGIPIFVPAICDSSIGIGLVIARRSGVSIHVDQISDADEITRHVEKAEKTGVVYIGGGVPKNFIQQTQVIGSIHKSDCTGHDFAVQFTTDNPHFGGLSGCTFEEAVSWGKETVESVRAQCFCDATIALPIVTSALISSGIARRGGAR